MSTVLITGAARGPRPRLRETVRRPGAGRVHACARTPDALKQVKGDLHPHTLEVTDYAAVKALAARLEGEAIDVLICNAGISGKEATVLGSIDPAVWRETFEVNALAPLMMAEAFADHVAASQDRKLVAISSRLGSIAFANSGRYSYRASKAALNMEWKGPVGRSRAQGPDLRRAASGVGPDRHGRARPRLSPSSRACPPW